MNLTVEKVKKHCVHLLLNSRCNEFSYHNTKHTLDVFENINTIATFENSEKNELEVMQIAALFHDTGFSELYIGHEKKSKEIAVNFLKQISYPTDKITMVTTCICATQMPQISNTNLEGIICDADLFHLASPNFFEKNLLLREEWNAYLNKTFTDEQWVLLNIDFLTNHRYKTQYGKEFLQPKKMQNINKLKTLFH